MKTKETPRDNNEELWTDFKKSVVWVVREIVAGLDPNEYRLDRYGCMIRWSEYGNRNSQFGWELDHIIPEDKGGKDILENFQALHWRNNVLKSANLNWQPQLFNFVFTEFT